MWVERNYQRLVNYAGIFTDCPADLVNHTYIKMVNAEFTHVSDPQTDRYFRLSIKTNGTVGDFNRLYKIKDCKLSEGLGVEEPDNTDLIQREVLDEVVRYLDEFDRKVFELYLQNQNMKEFSEESGIPLMTIYKTIERIKKQVRERL